MDLPYFQLALTQLCHPGQTTIIHDRILEIHVLGDGQTLDEVLSIHERKKHMSGDEKVPLFVFRRRSAHLANDHSQDLAADIEQGNETTFFVIDPDGNHHQLQKKDYLHFSSGDIQYVLVDVHSDQSRWLLVDSWKQYGDEGYEIASYDAGTIQEATAEAKSRNATTVYPTQEQVLERILQIIEEIRRYH